MEERILPHDEEAERAVLGAVLMDGVLFYQAVLEAEDFYLKDHRAIWRAYERVSTESGADAIDTVTLRDALLRGGSRLEDVGGPAYLSALVDGLPRFSNIEHYVRIVKDKSLLRRMIEASRRTIGECYAGGTAKEVFAADAARRAGLEGQRIGVRLEPVGKSAAATMESLATQEQRDILIPHGWERDLGRFNLWPRGDVSIIAARPSVGKTMFMCNCALAAAQRGKRVLFFSKEDGGEKLRRRMVATLGGLSLRELMSRLIPAGTFRAIPAAMDELMGLPIEITDGITYGMDELLSMANAAVRERRVDLVIVDYLQKFGGVSDHRVRELGVMMERMKEYADAEGAHVMVGAQVRRVAIEKERGRIRQPRMEDVKESGDVEQSADQVVMLHRESYYSADRKGAMGSTDVIVDKNRNGETGLAELYFDGATQQVRSAA